MANSLVMQIVKETGLPTAPVYRELNRLIVESGKTEATISMDEIRELLAEYLQDIFSELATN